MFTNAEAKEFGMNYYYNYSNTTGPPSWWRQHNLVVLVDQQIRFSCRGQNLSSFFSEKGPKNMAFFSCFLSQSVWATFYIMIANTWFVKGEIDENGNTNRYWCKNVNFLLHFSMVFDWNFWCGIYWWNLPQNVEKSRGPIKVLRPPFAK